MLLSTFDNYELMIITVNHGRAVERGTHDELLERVNLRSLLSNAVWWCANLARR